MGKYYRNPSKPTKKKGLPPKYQRLKAYEGLSAQHTLGVQKGKLKDAPGVVSVMMKGSEVGMPERPFVGHAVFVKKWRPEGKWYMYNSNDYNNRGLLPADGFHTAKWNKYERPLLKRRVQLSDIEDTGACHLTSANLEHIATNVYDNQQEFENFLLKPERNTLEIQNHVRRWNWEMKNNDDLHDGNMVLSDK